MLEKLARALDPMPRYRIAISGLSREPILDPDLATHHQRPITASATVRRAMLHGPWTGFLKFAPSCMPPATNRRADSRRLDTKEDTR